jgi:glycosyltransferase involved in cell wall biosynthesis
MSLPQVSVIVPCRNEGRFIGECLESILGNDYPTDRMEVLVVDGMSTDGTRERVETLAARYANVRLLANRRRITPAALNLGIRAASGDYLLWMSAHNTYDPGYIRNCVEYARRYGADNTGGRIVTVPRDATMLAPFIIAALTHFFGVGGSAFRVPSTEPRWVDTVFGGCYRRDVFERIGLFNEELRRGQDMEFNLRLKRAGLRTLLVPSVQSVYHARSRFWEFIQHNWTNGVWAVLPFLYVSRPPVGWRHLVPLAFVSSLTIGVALSFLAPHGWRVLALIGGAYLAAACVASFDVARRLGECRYAVVMPVVFLSLHLSYGLGSLWGMVCLCGRLLRRVSGPVVAGEG